MTLANDEQDLPSSSAAGVSSIDNAAVASTPTLAAPQISAPVAGPVSSSPSWISGLSTSWIASDMSAADVNGSVTYSGILNLFTDLENNLSNSNSTLTSAEDADLVTIANNLNNGMSTSMYLTQMFKSMVTGSSDHTWTNGSTSSSTLYNMGVGANSGQVSELIGKWLLGTDLPNSSVTNIGDPTFTVTYSTSTSPIFGSSGPVVTDVNQGFLGDCFYEAGLAEVCMQDQSAIESMFVNNGNGTYGIRFFNNGLATYVTINTQLADGGTEFNYGANIWASLAEKAYTQLQGLGNFTGDNYTYGNAWNSIANGGYIEDALETITGASQITDFTANSGSWGIENFNSAIDYTSYTAGYATSTIQNQILNDLANHDDVIINSISDQHDSNGKLTLIASHAMPIYGFDAATGMFEVRNPWGVEANQTYDTTFEVSLASLLSYGDWVTTDNLGTMSAPNVSLTSSSIQSGDVTISVSGSINAADAGETIGIYDNGTLVSQVTSNNQGGFGSNISVATGVHTLTAVATNTYGQSVAAQTVTYVDNATASLNGNGGIVDFAGLSGNDTVTLTGSGVTVNSGSNLLNLRLSGSGESVSEAASDWMQVNGSNNSVSVANGADLGAGGGGNQINATADTAVTVWGMNGNFDTINVSSDAFGASTAQSNWSGIYLQAGADANVNGSSNGINVLSQAVLNVTGNANTINGSVNTVISVTGSGGSNNVINVSGDQFGAQTTNSQWTGVYIQANTAANVNGSADGISVAGGSVANIAGGGDTVDATSHTVVNLSGMGGNFDTLYVSNDAFGSHTSNGQWTGIYLQGSSEATLYGSGDGINVAGSSVLNDIGGGNTITASSQSVVDVSGMNGNFDTITVSGDQFGAQTANGQWSGVYVVAGGEANVTGSNDGINVGVSAVLDAIGGGNTILSVADTAVLVSGMNGTFDTINVGSDAFGSQTANGYWSGIYLQAGADANLNGGSNGISVAAGAVLNAYGGGNTINTTSDTAVAVSGMSGTFDTINVSGDQFGSQTTNQQWSGIYLEQGADVNFNGTSNGLSVATDAVLNVTGGGNTIDATTATVVSITGTNGTADTINVSNDAFGAQTWNQQWSGIYLRNAVTATVNGTNNGINVGSSDNLTINGSGNTVTASGSSDTFVYGSGFGTQSISGFSTASDVVSLASSEFANFAAVLADATNSGSNVVIHANNDYLTLIGINKSSLVASDFSFHA